MYNCTCCNHAFNHRTENITNSLKADLATKPEVLWAHLPAQTSTTGFSMHLENSQGLAVHCVRTWVLHCSTAQRSRANPLAQAQTPVFPLSEQHSFSSVLEPPSTPQGAAGKHCTHFPSVAEVGPGSRMQFFSMGKGYVSYCLIQKKFLQHYFIQANY